MSILKHELTELNAAFGLDESDRYIIVWGASLFNELNRVARTLRKGEGVTKLEDCQELSGYKVCFFPRHYCSIYDNRHVLPDKGLETCGMVYDDFSAFEDDRNNGPVVTMKLRKVHMLNPDTAKNYHFRVANGQLLDASNTPLPLMPVE